MRRTLQIGVVCGLLVLAGGTTAEAQVAGTAASTPMDDDSDEDPTSDPAPEMDRAKEETRIPPPAARRSSYYDRVKTTVRREVPAPPSAAARGLGLGGQSPVPERMSQAGSVGPYSARALQARAQEAANAQVPKGSSRREPQRSEGPRVTVRSTTHNFYPGLRPAQHPNANTAPTRRSRRPVLLPGRGGIAAGPARAR